MQWSFDDIEVKLQVMGGSQKGWDRVGEAHEAGNRERTGRWQFNLSHGLCYLSHSSKYITLPFARMIYIISTEFC